MEAFFVSLGLVALGEIGDKTQILALLLAATFRRPVPIILGIVTATLANHFLAGLVGVWLGSKLGGSLHWIAGVAFLAMAAWVLVPDRLESGAHAAVRRLGVYGATVASFFLAEIGDKTQVATVALATRYGDLAAVVGGSTLGMLLVDVPSVLIGGALSQRLPMRALRLLTAAVFAILGVLALLAGQGN